MNKRKKIVVMAEWFAPGFKAGGPITSIVNLVNTISEADFYVITSDRDLLSDRPYDNIRCNEWTVYNEHTKVIYLNPDSHNNRFIGKLLSEIHFDVIYLNSMFSLWYTLMPLWWCSRRGHKEKVVLAPRGMLKDGALSVKSTKKKYFLQLVRLARLFRRITWHASSPDEANEIRKYFGSDCNIVVVPNIPNIASAQLAPIRKEKGSVRLVTVARISPEKGFSEAVRFLDQPSLKSYSFNWTWYGPVGDEAYFDECITRLGHMPHVHFEYAGELNPIQIPERVGEAHFFYLATRGENFGHSIAEALSLGRPVIISNKTPWQGLESDRAGFSLEPDDEPFERALKLAAEMDQETYSSWSDGSRRYLLRTMKENDALWSTRTMFGIAVK